MQPKTVIKVERLMHQFTKKTKTNEQAQQKSIDNKSRIAM
jgi:hypothetical protein